MSSPVKLKYWPNHFKTLINTAFWPFWTLPWEMSRAITLQPGASWALLWACLGPLAGHFPCSSSPRPCFLLWFSCRLLGGGVAG